MEITSVNNKLIKETTKLHKKKYRDESNLFLMEGYHLYEEAKSHGVIQTVFTIDRSIKGENVIYVTDIILQKLSQSKSPQGIVTVCEKVNKKDITDNVLILEKIQDPGNLGTLLRSALGFGFNTVVLDNTCDLYNEKVIRSTQGNLFKLNIIEMSTLDFMNTYPHTVYGTAMEGSDLDQINTKGQIAIVLGNEGSGVSSEVLQKTDKNITIQTNIESLNVGVAGSIIMHYVHRKR